MCAAKCCIMYALCVCFMLQMGMSNTVNPQSIQPSPSSMDSLQNSDNEPPVDKTAAQDASLTFIYSHPASANSTDAESSERHQSTVDIDPMDISSGIHPSIAKTKAILDIRPTSVLESPLSSDTQSNSSDASGNYTSRFEDNGNISFPLFTGPSSSLAEPPIRPASATYGIDPSSPRVPFFSMSHVNTQPHQLDSTYTLSLSSTYSQHLPMSATDSLHLSSSNASNLLLSTSDDMRESFASSTVFASYQTIQSTAIYLHPSASIEVNRTASSLLVADSSLVTDAFNMSTAPLSLIKTSISATASFQTISTSSYITAFSTPLLSSAVTTGPGSKSEMITGNGSTPDMVSEEMTAITETSEVTSLPSEIIKSTTIPSTQHSYTPKDSIYQFVFEGNCSVITASQTLTHSFLRGVRQTLAEELFIESDRISTGAVVCGSIIVNVTIEDTEKTSIDDRIIEIIASGNFSFSINNTDSKGFLHLQAIGMKVLVSPQASDASQSPPGKEPFEESLFRGFWELSETERILIIVFSVLGGFLFIMALAYIVHVCCLQGQTKSFDLGDTPDHEVKMEDFTLTKLQRPPTIYDEHGMILTEDLYPGQTKLAIPYIPQGHTGACCKGHGVNTAVRDSPVVIRRPNNSQFRGSSENLVMHHQLPQDKDGIDNMSFSSDDILGDGGSSDSDMGSPRRKKPGDVVQRI